MGTRIRQFFGMLGPGLITGAADDDPSGISTYSVAGAATGYSMLWLTLVSTPMMAVIQGMCARIAMVNGEGLAAVVRKRFPPGVAYRWPYWLSPPTRSISVPTSAAWRMRRG